MQNKKLTRRQEIVFQLYKKGLTQEQIAQKLKTYQGTIGHIIIAIKKKGYEQEIEELKQKNRDKITPELSGKWLEIEKELNDSI